jgi:hypothetical protein
MHKQNEGQMETVGRNGALVEDQPQRDAPLVDP